MNKNDYYTNEEIKNLLQVTTQTLMNWRKAGKLKYIKVSKKVILYPKKDIDILLNKPVSDKQERVNVMYCRVSNTKQKDDLEKQKQILLDYCNSNGIIINKIYEEIASGMNEDRSELNKLIDDVIDYKIDTVYITYKDRLTRFGFRYFENLFDKYNTQIVVLNNNINQENFEQELTEDLISIIHHFSMKMYSIRRKQLKKIQKEIQE